MLDHHAPVLVTQQGRIFDYGTHIGYHPYKDDTKELDLASLHLDNDKIISIFKQGWYVFFVSQMGAIYFRNLEDGKKHEVERLDLQIAPNEGIKDIKAVLGEILFLTQRGNILQWRTSEKSRNIAVPQRHRIKSMHFDEQGGYSLFLSFDGDLFVEVGL